MDEYKLLDECITIKLTPFQTLLLSETVIMTNTILEFLIEHNGIEIERVTENGLKAPESEQTGGVLIQSSLAAMKEIRIKIWKNGKGEIGEMIPEEFAEVMDLYTTVLNGIGCQFIQSLVTRER